jgi:hypothetical protein
MTMQDKRTRRKTRKASPTDAPVWMLGRVPWGFWTYGPNRRAYMEWLGERLGFKKPEDWYRVTGKDFRRNFGGRLLAMFADSPAAVLKDYLRRYSWKEWLFERAPQNFWDDPLNQRRYMDWLAKRLRLKTSEDWYKVTVEHFTKNHGKGLLAKFRGSPTAAIRAYRPTYDWKEWLFVNAPHGFWEEPANRRRYMDWLSEQLGIRRTEDWYKVTGRAIRQFDGGLLSQLGDSPVALVKDYLPDYEWKEWLFPTVPNEFWDQPLNRWRYMHWLGEQLGVNRPEDWYRLTGPTIRRHRGTYVLKKFNYSPTALLKDYWPDYDWKEWLFPNVPRGFWAGAANRRRYMAWLGEQLGFDGPEPWSRVRKVDFERFHGHQILKRFGYNVRAVVDEYLHGVEGGARALAASPA